MNQKLLIIVLVLALALAGLFFLFSKNDGKLAEIKPSFSVGGTIKLDPSSGNKKVGETFPVNIKIDTAGKSIDGVDIFALNYDSKVLEVVDGDSAVDGIQINQGKIFPIFIGNKVDKEKGKITISGIVTPGEKGYKGAGVMATVNFKAISAGPAKINFDFNKDSTVDTNMVEHGSAKEVLEGVQNASFIIQ